MYKYWLVLRSNEGVRHTIRIFGDKSKRRWEIRVKIKINVNEIRRNEEKERESDGAKSDMVKENKKAAILI